MSEFELGTWSARLPEWSNDELSEEEREELARALAEDPDLRAEADLVERLRAARPEPPPDLAARISARLDAEQKPSRRRLPGGWQLSSAAVLVLALGTAVIWRNQGSTLPTTMPGDVLDPVAESWLLDDGVIAGAAMLDELSDEVLESLLDDLGV